MFFFLYSLLVAARLSKIIKPNETYNFFEELTTNDFQLNFALSNLVKDENLFITIKYQKAKTGDDTKKDEEMIDSDYSSDLDDSENNNNQYDFDGYEKIVSEAINKDLNYIYFKRFNKFGKYYISLKNNGEKNIEFQISSIIQKKVNEANKDLVEIKNLLNNIQVAMDRFGNENYYLNSLQVQNIEDATRIYRSMNWLIIFPILTLVIGYLKYILAVQLVKPKRERFKGLF